MCLFSSAYSYADETEGNGIKYSGTGFLTVGAGKMLGGDKENVGGFNCPCFVSDYAQAAIYDGRPGLQWGPDSKLGLQGDVSFDNQRAALTVQAVSRGASDGNVDLEWLYGSYKLNDKVTLQAGRMRLPMFYYSESQDIGVSLPWTHLPAWLYGWQIVNFDGGKVRYQDQFGEWSSNASFFAGNEHHKDAGYWKVYGNGQHSVTNVNWTNILGGDLTLVKDWFETRLVYIQSNTQDQLISFLNSEQPQTNTLPAPVAKQEIVGLTLKADYKNWELYSEIINIKHPGLTYEDFSQNVSAGYRYGKWLPMVTWGHYNGLVSTDGLPNAPSSEANHEQTIAWSLKYDLTTSSDLKMEYDVTQVSPASYWGASRLLTFAYDKVF